MTVLAVQHTESLASATLFLALIGIGLLAAGVALGRVLLAESRRRRRACRDRSPVPDLPSAPVPAVRGAQPRGLVAVDGLADVLERSRRLIAAEERVARELIGAAGWVVERYVLVGNQRVPFVLVGPTGVFVLCATDGAWTLYDLEVLSRLGDELRDRLPGYRGRVEAVVCLAYDRAEPRAWYGGADRGGRGGWVLGVEQLLSWLDGWGTEDGLASVDVSRIAAEAGPHWQRRSAARLPVRGNAG
jgi:hypothetical protein